MRAGFRSPVSGHISSVSLLSVSVSHQRHGLIIEKTKRQSQSQNLLLKTHIAFVRHR